MIFLLDKNILYGALECNELFRQLIESVYVKCHRLAISNSLSVAYWNILGERRNRVRSHFPNIARYLSEITHAGTKSGWVEDIETVPGQDIMHKKEDHFMVKIAYQRNVILVSNSSADRRRFIAWANSQNNRSRAVTPRRAVDLAQQPC